METKGEQSEPSITDSSADPEAGHTRLCKKPDWFQITLTSWTFPKEIQCAKTLPRDSNPIGIVCWSYAPGMDRQDHYEITTNRGRKKLILWCGFPKDSGRGCDFVPIVYGPSRSPDGRWVHPWHAATHFLVAYWKAEKDDSGVFDPPHEVYGGILQGYLEAICREVCPELFEEAK